MATNVRVLAFARLRELLGSERTVSLPDGATLADLWERIASDVPALRDHRASTRLARNGEIAGETTTLAAGDEIALLPPVGGG